VSVKICKNDERNAPDQVMLGDRNTSYCVLLVIDTWLEYFISPGHMSNTNFAIIIQMRRDKRNGEYPALRII